MVISIYDTNFTLHGDIDEIDSLIWTRRYWSCGEFKLLVPSTARHSSLLKIGRLLIKRGDNEAGVILYRHIKTDDQGDEVIELQGYFITGWIGKRVVRNQIITTDTPPEIMRRIVRENVTNPTDVRRRINNITLALTAGINRPAIEYVSEEFTNALLALEAAAKASSLGFGVYTDFRAGQHSFQIYEGKNFTASHSPTPCIFSHENDTVLEQELLISIENVRSTAYVGGEEKENEVRQIIEVNPQASGLARDEVYINASDIRQEYKEKEHTELTMTGGQVYNAYLELATTPLNQYIAMLRERGIAELENYTETLAFSSKINQDGNLQYKRDYNVGDLVTCVNTSWGVSIDVRITEVTETYQPDSNDLHVTFGENLPTLFDAMRHIIT